MFVLNSVGQETGQEDERQKIGRGINPNLPSSLTSLDDPSIENASVNSPSLFGERDGFAGRGQGTPYPINRFVSYMKVSKNFKRYIFTMANNVILKSLVDA